MELLIAFWHNPTVQWICWLVALYVAIQLVFTFVGFRTMCHMFPEGLRWWHTPVQLLTLVLFAYVLLLSPALVSVQWAF